MEKIGYALLLIVALAWLVAMVAGLVVAFPWGIFGLLAILALGLLFIKVIKERLANEEDDYYSKKVDK